MHSIGLCNDIKLIMEIVIDADRHYTHTRLTELAKNCMYYGCVNEGNAGCVLIKYYTRFLNSFVYYFFVPV
jgi:hypothetical protein